MEKTQRALVATSVFYLLSASTGARIAIDEDLPISFLGHTSRNMPQEDFVRGMGTALSPGVRMLAAQVALTWLAARRGPLGGLGATGLALYGVAATVGMLGEQITYYVFHPKAAEPEKAVIVTLNIVLPLAMVGFGMAEWKRRR